MFGKRKIKLEIARSDYIVFIRYDPMGNGCICCYLFIKYASNEFEKRNE